MRALNIIKIAPVIVSALLVGCSPAIRNLTPGKVPANPSGIYTISMSTSSREGAVVDDSVEANIVINGSVFPMERNPYDRNIFDFDYVMPEDQSEAAFYFMLDYDLAMTGGARPRRVTSQLHNFRVINRYLIQMQVDRAPVGRPVAVLGRQFFRSDRIMIGGVEAETRFKSSNELEFIVPALPANQTYFVEIRSAGQTIPVGNFMVDSSVLRVAPTQLDMRTGETRMLVFSVDFEAPRGGLPVEVTTNIPASVVMPEVVIPAGARSVNIPVQGGVDGSGFLFANIDGMKELIIPVTVRPAQ